MQSSNTSLKQIGLFGISPKGKYKSYKGDMNGTVKNLLIHKEVDEEKHKTKYVRDFNTIEPNEKWSTDVSKFHIAAGKLYLALILDMYNDEIIACDISLSPDFSQQKRLLDKAFSKSSRSVVFFGVSLVLQTKDISSSVLPTKKKSVVISMSVIASTLQTIKIIFQFL